MVLPTCRGYSLHVVVAEKLLVMQQVPEQLLLHVQLLLHLR